MTTITRSQLKGAIEAGITAVQLVNFTPDDAAALRAVGETATVVARGAYAARHEGGKVSCPVALAFPGWPGQFTWNQRFTQAYDAATFRALDRQSVRWPDCCVLHITEDDQREAAVA